MLELFVRDDDGRLYSLLQTGANDGWSNWRKMESPGCNSIAKSPATGPVNYIDVLGTVVYVITSEGLLYSTQKPFAEDSFSDWSFLGGGFGETPAVVVDGSLIEWLFVVGEDGILYRQAVGISTWIPWPNVLVTGTPSVGHSLDGRLEVFVVGIDGDLLHRWERNVAGSGDWSDWHSHDNPGVALRASPVIGQSADGRLEFFVVGEDGDLYHIWQLRPNEGWSDWHSHGNPGVPLLASPAIGRSADGRGELFVVGEDGDLYHVWQTRVNEGWSNWHSHGNPGVPLLASPAIGQSADGRGELFVVGEDGDLYHIWQTRVNEGWSDWHSHGRPQPFDIFPIAWYDLSDFPAHPPEIAKETGINGILMYNRDLAAEYLDAVKGTGLRVVVQVPLPVEPITLKQFIHEFKERPEVFGWSLADEPPSDGVTDQTAATFYQIIKTEDPTRPVCIVFNPQGEPEKYQTAMDVFMFDDYILFAATEFEGNSVGAGRPLADSRYFRLLRDKAQNASGKQAYWIVLQSEQVTGHRAPTPAELRYLIYASIQAGANGIFFYRYDEVIVQDATWVDRIHAPVVREFAPLATIFAQRSIAGKVTTLEPFVLPSLYRNCVGNNKIGYLLLLVHHNGDTVTTSITLDSLLQITQVTRIDDGANLQLRNNTFTETFGPFEVRLYQLSSS